MIVIDGKPIRTGATTIGARIQLTRFVRRMTIKDLGAACGVTRKAVYNWEKDVAYPELLTFVKLCSALNVKADDLLGETS